jgi:hypothetical protein
MSSDDNCSLASSSICFDDDEDFSVVHSESKNNRNGQEASIKQAPTIAENEDKWVSRTRFLVFLVLAGAATAVGILTYRFLKDDQQEDFENDVSGDNDDKMHN